jgi:DNA repair exonuclease SbcCD nuclease subunit
MDEVRHGLHLLEVVLRTARSVRADLLLLVGDVFDHNRVGEELLHRTTEALAAAGMPTVILPGNHDCLVPHSVYRRGRFADTDDVHVLGITTTEDTARFPDLDLEVWGRPHLDLFDMTPLREPPQRALRWQIAAAHGHWVTGPHDEHRAYLIHDHEIRATAADYVALGHWDRWTPVGDGTVPAYYSGSPFYAKTVNLIEFGASEAPRIERVPVVHAPD